MKVQLVVRALLGTSAAFAITQASGALVRRPAPDATFTADGDVVARSDSLRGGRSGKLRGPLFTFLTQRPFADKVNGRIGQYLIGFWPGEHRRVTTMAYQNPRGFIEVTPDNQDTRVS